MLALLLALLLQPAALADDVEVQATTTVGAGEGDASITFIGHVAGRIDVGLSCGGRRYSLAQPISQGSSHTLPLPGLGTGQHRCTGQLKLTTPEGDAEMPLSFTVNVLPALKLKVDEADLDLSAKSLVLQADRPLKSVSIEVFGGEAGERIGGSEIMLQHQDRAELSWRSEGEILRIDIVATDVHGVRGKLTLLPWTYAIPHVDVIFESAQAEILPAEVPKLEAAWGHIEDTLRKYGEIVDMELFVAGYTDTVGDAAYNQGLSQRRAQAIARWFRERGFQGPIWVQGFGESVPAVGTPDETDEPANRRAVYVLAAQKPVGNPELPRADWAPLR